MVHSSGFAGTKTLKSPRSIVLLSRLLSFGTHRALTGSPHICCCLLTMISAMAILSLPDDLLLALDPSTISRPSHLQSRASHPLEGLQAASGAGPDLHGLHPWDVAMLCGTRTGQHQSDSDGGGRWKHTHPMHLHVPAWAGGGGDGDGDGVGDGGGDGRSDARHRAGNGLPQQASQRNARSIATLGGGVIPPLAAGCTWTTLPGGDDDDPASQALNWTDGSVHCSHAGLTAIPPLPPNAQYL